MKTEPVDLLALFAGAGLSIGRDVTDELMGEFPLDPRRSAEYLDTFRSTVCPSVRGKLVGAGHPAHLIDRLLEEVMEGLRRRMADYLVSVGLDGQA